MAPKKKRLGTYVRERRQKYRHPYRLLFHVSTAPRKVLVPHRTTYQEPWDDERQHPLLFLCPFHDIKQWLSWCAGKFSKPHFKEVANAFSGKGHMVLYVHIVRVDPASLAIPRRRYHQEFTTRDALRPVAIVPIRYQCDKPLNLSRVASKIEQVKEWKNDRGTKPCY
jgi:hypothetical protein